MGLKARSIGKGLEKVLRLPLPRPRVSTDPPVKVSRVLVFGKFPNPTFDYYFAARLSASGMPPFQQCDIRNFDGDSVDADGAFVIIVRYASNAVARWIGNHRDKLAGVAIFLDDDIAGLITGREASLSYRYRLLRQSLLPLRSLNGMVDMLWVSTETLARSLSYARPHVLPPAPGPEMLPKVSTGGARTGSPGAVRLAYHATAIHVEEHRFLAPIIREVLNARPHATFEVFAEGRSEKLWRGLGLERVTVKRPLPWTRYLEESRQAEIDIMLVPVAPNHVNDCRAETKRIDIARVGAAGIMSDCPAFRPAEEGEILLGYDKTLWISQILALIDDPSQRARVASATLGRVEALARRSATGIEGIIEKAASQD